MLLFFLPPPVFRFYEPYTRRRARVTGIEKMIRVGAGQLLQCFGLERQALATRRLTAWRHSE